MDGTLPIELKQLPRSAKESRRQILALSRKIRKHPQCYCSLASPLIPKGDAAEDSKVSGNKKSSP